MTVWKPGSWGGAAAATLAWHCVDPGVNVFFGDAFVATTKIGNVSPGEAFSVFLGADAAVKVKHKPVRNVAAAGPHNPGFLTVILPGMRSIHPRIRHLCGWIERIPGGNPAI